MNYKPIIIVAGEPNSIFLEIFFKALKYKKYKSPILLICSLKILNLQMKNFIAKNKDDYFDKAISFQNNPDIKKNFGNNLRNKALSSPLFDTKNFTKDFTETLKKIYLQHLSFDKV